MPANGYRPPLILSSTSCMCAAFGKSSQVELLQAHLFSAMNHGLALDFFHIAPGEKPLRQELSGIVEDAICAHRHTAESDEAGLPLVENPPRKAGEVEKR